ncbi:hypothetical protein QN382_23255, partial [Pseudomonas sp. 10B1]|nr:hypothetical protein [Pseudomonas sp. 10B1]
MYQIDNASVIPTIPASTPASTVGFFTDGNPAAGLAPTIVPAEFLNMLMVEMLGVLTAGGVTPSKSKFNQLATAIRNINIQALIAVDTGTAGVYVATNSPPLTALPTSGYVQWVIISHSNPGASTYSPDGLTAKPIYGMGLQALQGSELPVGLVQFKYLIQAGVNGGNGAWIVTEAFGGALQIAPGVNSTQAATVAQLQAGYGSFAVDTGVANAYVCNFTPALTARVESAPLRFKAKTTNTTACTVNDGLGVTPLVGGAHAGLQGGEIVANGDGWMAWNSSVGGGSYVLLFCTGAPEQGSPATQSQHFVNAGQIQTQALTAFTTTGTAPAFVLTPVPAILAYAAGQRFRIKLHASGAGSDTINISSLGQKNYKQYDSTGNKVAAVLAAGQLTDIEYDGTDFVLLDPLPTTVVQATETVFGGGKVATQALTNAGADDTTFVTPKKFSAGVAALVVAATQT